MAFSLFGKRDTPTPDQELKQPEQKGNPPRGLFDRMKQAVTRTRDSLSESLSSIAALTREIDIASLDDLELALLASDIGSATTNEILTKPPRARPPPGHRLRRRTQGPAQGRDSPHPELRRQARCDANAAPRSS